MGEKVEKEQSTGLSDDLHEYLEALISWKERKEEKERRIES